VQDDAASRPDDDAILIEGLKKNDQIVILRFLDRYLNPIISFIMKRGVSRGDAEELASLVVEKVADSIDRFDRSRGKFSTWVFTIAERLSIDHFRKEGRRSKVDAVPLTVDDIAETSNGDGSCSPTGPRDPALKRLFLKAFLGLGAEDRSVLCLTTLEWSHAEIGVISGKSPDAVKVQAHRARNRLKEAVKKIAQEESVKLADSHWDALNHWRGQKEVEL